MGRLLKIYFWQIISILLSFASLFVVTPYLTTNPGVFGIYTIVTSLVLFLSYADLGFIGAGTKYASEFFAQKKLVKEIEMIGFVGFIFSGFALLYTLVLFYLAYNPGILVKGLTINTEETARKLLFVLAVSSPIFVGQRLLQIIFTVRLEDYRYQRILILFNLIKIFSVLYFFREGRYDIVGFFIFSQVCGLFALICGAYVAKRNFSYDFKLLVKSLTYNKEIYLTVSKLAYSSLFLTVCWIAYYDLPPFVISKTLGSYQVAMYAIGLTLIGLFRALFGVIFSPFNAKFNHYIGLKDIAGLKSFVIKVLGLSLPVTVFPVLIVSTTAKSFIYSWVGVSYADSIAIAQFLVLSYIWSFISYPAGILIMAMEKVQSLIITSAILPAIYWIGVAISYRYWGIESFAIFKLIAFTFAAAAYTLIVLKLLDLTGKKLIADLVAPAILPVILLIAMLFFIRDYLPEDKSKINLLIYGVANLFVFSFATLVYYFTSKIFRLSINELFLKVRIRYLPMTGNNNI